MALTVVIVFERFESEFSQEVKELVVELWLRHLLDEPLEFVNKSDIYTWYEVLNGAVYHSDHLLMFAKLAFP